MLLIYTYSYIHSCSYICSYILHVYSYTVILSFIEKITITKYYSPSLNVPLVVEQNSDVTTSRAKKRWYLAYTLVQNPDLIKLRRRDHPEKDTVSDKEPTINIGHHVNPGYVDGDHELGIPLEKDDSTKM